MRNIISSKLIYTLPLPVWKDSAGLDKGLNHDRQHLGIILAAGQVLKIRQTNAIFNQKLTCYLLNGDRKTEIKFSFGNTWVEVKTTKASVLFIETPYIEGQPQVTFKYADDTKILSVYYEGEGNRFFSMLGEPKRRIWVD